jgi:hypothetical protein
LGSRREREPILFQALCRQGDRMILRNRDRITIETFDKDEIERLKRRGFVDIYDDMASKTGKKKVRTAKRSTKGMKEKRSMS